MKNNLFLFSLPTMANNRKRATTNKGLRRSRRLQSEDEDYGPDRISKKKLIKELTSYRCALVEWLKKDHGYIEKSVQKVIDSTFDAALDAPEKTLRKSTNRCTSSKDGNSIVEAQKELERITERQQSDQLNAENKRKVEVETLTKKFHNDLQKMLQRHSFQRLEEEESRAQELGKFVERYVNPAAVLKETEDEVPSPSESAMEDLRAEEVFNLEEKELSVSEEPVKSLEKEEVVPKSNVVNLDSFFVAPKKSTFSKYANTNTLQLLAESRTVPLWNSGPLETFSGKLGEIVDNQVDSSQLGSLKSKSHKLKRLFSYGCEVESEESSENESDHELAIETDMSVDDSETESDDC